MLIKAEQLRDVMTQTHTRASIIPFMEQCRWVRELCLHLLLRLLIGIQRECQSR